MPHFSLSLLGSLQITLDREPIRGVKSDKVRALLAHLSVEVDRSHRRELLAGLLWPEMPDQPARSHGSCASLAKARPDGRGPPDTG
jgi:DNA-binding SARP family transcriptional activator